MTRRLGVALLALAAAAVSLAAVTIEPAQAYPGAPWFEPNRVYTQNFPDPSVIVDGNRYVAYGTATGGAYLPAMTSTDLATWTAHARYNPNTYFPSDPFFNDALVQPPSWAYNTGDPHNWINHEIRAPGMARIGSRFVAFSTVRVAAPGETNYGLGRFCIGVATSTNAMGPFRDTTSTPIQCDNDPVGSIDPEPFVDPVSGTPYLLWKSEGIPGSMPQRIWIRQLTAEGTAFAAGSVATVLLGVADAWEGNVVENPSMVHFGGRYYLFHSGNEWRSDDYATGYSICDGPLGPCRRTSSDPLLDSGDRPGRLGPGGADAFVGLDGRLMIAYHYWNAPYTDYPAFPACQSAGTCTSQGQRRLAVEALAVGSDGSLRLAPNACPIVPAQGDTGRYIPLVPARILDTRARTWVRPGRWVKAR